MTLSFCKYAIRRATPFFLYRFLSKVRIPEEGLDFTKFLVAKYLVKEGGTIVDGGAHVGFYSRCYTELLRNKKGRLFSFEPNPYLFPLLQKTRSLPKKRHVFLQKALCKTSKERCSFFVRPFSLAEDSSLTETKSCKKVEVETLSLDSLHKTYDLQDCKLIKLDVEGNEPQVLEGASTLFREVSPWVIFEYIQKENKKHSSLTILENRGYVVFDLKTCRKIENPYQTDLTDLLAVPKKEEEKAEKLVQAIRVFII